MNPTDNSLESISDSNEYRTMIQRVRPVIVAYQEKQWEKFRAEYPHTLDLDDRHYTWDYHIESYDISPEIEEWLAENAPLSYGIHFRTIGFTHRDVAFAFKIRWL